MPTRRHAAELFFPSFCLSWFLSFCSTVHIVFCCFPTYMPVIYVLKTRLMSIKLAIHSPFLGGVYAFSWTHEVSYLNASDKCVKHIWIISLLKSIKGSKAIGRTPFLLFFFLFLSFFLFWHATLLPRRTKYMDKIDIHDLGVILLEIITGRPIICNSEVVNIMKNQVRSSF